VIHLIKGANIRAFFMPLFNANDKQTPALNSRLRILQQISVVMIFIIILQSGKLIPLYLSAGTKNIVYLHVANVSTHLLLFVIITILFIKGHINIARHALFFCFSSYLSFACILWQANVNLQYYFLLAMFISAYVYSHEEQEHALFWSSVQLILFIIASVCLPSISEDTSYSPEVLVHTRYVNAIAFAFASSICAIFIKRIIEDNWSKIKDYEYKQYDLLKRVFPEKLALTLIDKTQGQLQQNHQLAVLFLDICDFTQYAVNTGNQGLASWPKIYQLFAQFDLALAHLDVSRIKVNGDQYILLIGSNSLLSPQQFIAQQALQSVRILLQHTTLPVKIGLAFGDVTYGVFDISHPQFDIWGETVIRASRLEALAKPNCAIFDAASQDYLKHSASFRCERKLLKGIAYQDVYHLCPLKSSNT